MNNGRYRAVLFDLDGTLLNTISDIRDSMNIALKNHNFPEHDADTYKTFIGQGIEEFVAKSIPPKNRSENLILRLVDEMRAEYNKRWNSKTRPYSGIPELLDDLSERGVHLAVLSNKPDDFTKMMISEMLADWNFVFVRGARADIPRKPNPAGALDIAEKLNVSPSQCIYVGDSETDIKMAISAKMLPVGVGWGFRSKEQLTTCGASIVIDSPMDLLTIFDRN